MFPHQSQRELELSLHDVEPIPLERDVGSLLGPQGLPLADQHRQATLQVIATNCGLVPQFHRSQCDSERRMVPLPGGTGRRVSPPF